VRRPWQAAWVGVWLAAVGCGAPRATGPFQPSAASAAVGVETSGESTAATTGELLVATTEETAEESSEASSQTTTENTEQNESSQQEYESSGTQATPVASASGAVLTTTVLGAVFWKVAEQMRRNPRRGRASPRELARAFQSYLNARTYQLREDLALGAGPTVEDLAALAHIRREHLGIFGRLLRAHRKELLELADTRALTPERALQWLQRVGEIALTDPRLEEDRDAFLVTYGLQEAEP
jgi:hypothetical protein